MVDRIYATNHKYLFPMIVRCNDGTKFFTAITNKKALKHFLRTMNPKKYADNHRGFFVLDHDEQRHEMLNYGYSEKEIILAVEQSYPLVYKVETQTPFGNVANFSFDDIIYGCHGLPHEYHKSGQIIFTTSDKWKCIYIEDILPTIKAELKTIKGFKYTNEVYQSNGVMGGFAKLKFVPTDIGNGTIINPEIVIDCTKIYNRSISVRVFLTIVSCSNVLSFEGWEYIKQYAEENQIFKHLCNRKIHRGDDLDFSFLSDMFTAVNGVGSLFENAKNIKISLENVKDLLIFYNGKHKISARNATKIHNMFCGNTLYDLVMDVSSLASNESKLPNKTKLLISVIAGEILLIGENIDVFLENARIKPLMHWETNKFVTNVKRAKPTWFERVIFGSA